jgi:N-acyl homoserine lactone hydrolase
MQMRTYAFFGGSEVVDKSLLMAGRDMGVPARVPFLFFLIEHPKGRMLFDTGYNPAVLSHPGDYGPAREFPPTVHEEDLVINRLAEIGLKPEQIDMVANSHLHYDHCGGNCFFPSATFLVQFDELQSAMWPEPYAALVAGAYNRGDFDLKVHFEQLDGDYDVFGDQSVGLIRTPGHTRGHQSLVLRLPESGTLILAQDAAYLNQSLTEMILPAICWDPRQMYNSFRRLRDLQRHDNTLLIPGHDMEMLKEIKLAPMFYS